MYKLTAAKANHKIDLAKPPLNILKIKLPKINQTNIIENMNKEKGTSLKMAGPKLNKLAKEEPKQPPSNPKLTLQIQTINSPKETLKEESFPNKIKVIPLPHTDRVKVKVKV